MQIGNMGGHSDIHHVTECMHEHDHMKIKADLKSAGGAAQSASQSVGNTETVSVSNINTWLTNILNKSKNALGRIWGGLDSSGVSAGSAAENAANKGVSSLQQGRAGSVQAEQSTAFLLRDPDKTVERTGNPWFVPVEHQGTVRTAHPGGVRERVKARFSSVSSFLAKHLPADTGTFSGMKKHKKEENLTRKSHYKDEEAEIECILTDDSYLLDSYDKNGEYRQIGK